MYEKIKKLRSNNTISQEELAKLMGISRPTLSQIELWERPLKDAEIDSLAGIFELPRSEFLDEEKIEVKKIDPTDPQAKLKNLILYILSKCGQKPNMGKILLNKLLYFSDFDYYEKTGDSITGSLYKKLPMWPVPLIMEDILCQMIGDWHIKVVEGQFFGYKQSKIIPAIFPDTDIFLPSQLAEVDRVMSRFSDMTGRQVSDFSHNDMPYRATKNIGDEISYGLVFYRDPKHYTVRDPEVYVD